MSSMTDVVFLLLIFFMIASTLAKQLNTIDVKLPQAKGKTENRSTVAVTIDRSGAFFIDDKNVDGFHYFSINNLQRFLVRDSINS